MSGGPRSWTGALRFSGAGPASVLPSPRLGPAAGLPEPSCGLASALPEPCPSPADSYRVDIDGGADDDPPGRDPIVGPPGSLLAVVPGCVLGGGAVGFGAEVGCGLLPVVPGFVVDFDADGACESLMDPPSRPDPCEASDAAGTPGSSGAATDEDCDSGDPLGTVPFAAAVEAPLLFDRLPGFWSAGLPQAAMKAQTRAAATAVAAALASATVPRLGMDATVAKTGRHAGGTRRCARCVRRDCSTVSGRDGFSLDNR